MIKTREIETEREALRKLRDELFSQEPPALEDEQLQRRMSELFVKALSDSRARKFAGG